jgi:hypothetical protein
VYTPISVEVYTSAYAGAFAGFNSGRPINSSDSADYEHAATIAGAFAQEFDTVFDTVSPTALQCKTITTFCESFWRDRFPTGSASEIAVNYSDIVRWIIAELTASSAYFALQGIDEGTCGGSAPSSFSPTFIAVPVDDDQDFNGNGTGGAFQLSPITIVSNDDDIIGTVIWNFENTAVQEGWIVLFNVQSQSANPEVNVWFNGSESGFVLNPTTCPFNGTGTNLFGTIFGIYYNGTAWQLLTNRLEHED